MKASLSMLGMGDGLCLCSQGPQSKDHGMMPVLCPTAKSQLGAGQGFKRVNEGGSKMSVSQSPPSSPKTMDEPSASTGRRVMDAGHLVSHVEAFSRCMPM